ncbi:MAG: ATP-binding protein [Bacteroidota bacterium]
MLRIDQVSVRNYKNLIADELRVNNFNIIVGPNNSGKSNFIQILSFLNHIINGSIDEVRMEFKRSYFSDFGWIKPLKSGEKGELLIELVFSDTIRKVQYRYKIVLGWRPQRKVKFTRIEFFIKFEDFDYKNIHKTGPPISVFKRNENSISFGTGLKGISSTQIPENVSVIGLLKVLSKQFSNDDISFALKSLNSLLKTETIYFSNIELSKPGKSRMDKFSGRTVSFDIINEIVNIWEQGKDFGYFKEVLKTILQIDDIRVLELGSKSGDEDEGKSNKEYFVMFSHMGSNKQLWNFSDGSVLLIALITKILISDSDIFLIEEPENSLHPKALIDLIGFIQSFDDDRQFIIATHSIALINNINAEDVIIAKCLENGLSELMRVTDSSELRKTLKQGYIVFSDLLFFSPDEIV